MKTVSAIVIIAIVLVVISALYFYTERNIRFDKYGEAASDCIIEKKSGEVTLKCKTVLEIIERKEEDVACLNLQIISLGKKPIPLVICTNETKIQGLEDPNIYSEQKVPINLDIVYKKGIFQVAKFQKVSISLMPDSEISPILSDLYQRGLKITNVRRQADVELEKIKFFTHSLDLPGMEDFWFVMFRQAFVKEAFTKGEDMNFNVEVFVEDYKFNLNVLSKGLIFPRLNTEEVLLSKENISEITIDEKYSAGFLYLPKGTVIRQNQREEICKSYEKEIYLLDLFCSSNRTMESLLLEDDIETYIQKLGEIKSASVENLMFVVLEPYE